MSGETAPVRGPRRSFFELTLLVLAAYLAVGALLSVLYSERQVLREGFGFAVVARQVADSSPENSESVVVDAARQDEIDRYLAWSRPPTVATRFDPPISPPRFAPRYHLGARNKAYAILDPLTFEPLQSSGKDWEWAVLMARRGRLDLLDTATGVRSTLTGHGLEQSLDKDLGLSGQVTPVARLQLGHYRPAPWGLARPVSVAMTDRFAAEGDFVSRPFELKTERPVAVSVEAGLSNAWMSVQGRLHNQETSRQQEFSLMLREVHGQRTAGPGGDVGARSVGHLPAVPPGTYTLHLHAERSSASPAQLLVQVHEGGTHHWRMLSWLMVVVGVVGVGLGLVSPAEQKLSEA